MVFPGSRTGCSPFFLFFQHGAISVMMMVPLHTKESLLAFCIEFYTSNVVSLLLLFFKPFFFFKDTVFPSVLQSSFLAKCCLLRQTGFPWS